MKELNVHGSILENNLLFILKIHPVSPRNPLGHQLVKNTSSTVLEHSSHNTFHSEFHSAFHSTCLNSVAPEPVHSGKGKKGSQTLPDLQIRQKIAWST
jgi:hypothetical protein